ncbi:hypothetical protein [Clostridium beijerinckii]|uniref:hypothetical protein n=1 Tax=Clostridium beijerinckii TaxID=1520 RepID=UPI001FA74BB6|nr:hypothetical protein [Clostridium beijerinckii]
MKIIASRATKNIVEAMYVMPNPTCTTSAAIVPKMLTIMTVIQYIHGTYLYTENRITK